MFDIKEIGMVPPPYGGVSVYLKRLITKLNEDGFTAGAYSMDGNAPEGLDPALFHRWSWFETKYFPVKVFKYLKQFRNYRVIHSHMSLEAMIYLWAVKKVLGKKLVITVHNAMVDNYVRQSSRLHSCFLRKLAGDREVVWIAVSEEGKKQMEALPIHFASGIKVIPAYIPAMTGAGALDAKMQAYMDAHPANLVFYGHSFLLKAEEDIYGFREMLDIYAGVKRQIPDLGLVYCVSQADDAASQEALSAYARQLQLEDAVYWQFGAIPSMLPLWEKARVYVRPTRTDGDSIAVREALDAGVQVVTTDVVKRPEGCLVYHKGKVKDAVELVLEALKSEKQKRPGDCAHYEAMKAVYQSLLIN